MDGLDGDPLGAHALGGEGEVPGVEVEEHHAPGGPDGARHRAGVAAAAGSQVGDGLAGGGPQRVEDLLEEDGSVSGVAWVRGAHSPCEVCWSGPGAGAAGLAEDAGIGAGVFAGATVGATPLPRMKTVSAKQNAATRKRKGHSSLPPTSSRKRPVPRPTTQSNASTP